TLSLGQVLSARLVGPRSGTAHAAWTAGAAGLRGRRTPRRRIRRRLPGTRSPRAGAVFARRGRRGGGRPRRTTGGPQRGSPVEAAAGVSARVPARVAARVTAGRGPGSRRARTTVVRLVAAGVPARRRTGPTRRLLGRRIRRGGGAARRADRAGDAHHVVHV